MFITSYLLILFVSFQHPLKKNNSETESESKSNKIKSNHYDTSEIRDHVSNYKWTMEHQVVQGPINSKGIQTKLKVNHPNDPYEIEADRVAEHIIQMSDSHPDVADNGKVLSTIQRKCSTCEMKNKNEKEEIKISRKPISDNSLEISDEIANQINQTNGGKPLDGTTKSFMEPRFGYDFSRVRILDDSRSNELSRVINARAFTIGNNIFLGKNESVSDRHLMAHELTHVVQQQDSGQTTMSKLGEQSFRLFVDDLPSISHFQNIKAYRFASPEHRDIAHNAAGNVLTNIDIGDGNYLLYEEMVALAGDYFESEQQMQDLSRTPDGKLQIQWARWDAFHTGTQPSIPKNIQKIVMDRYYTLAARNISHFSAGGTALNSYRDYHINALRFAFQAGLSSQSSGGSIMTPYLWSEALTREAFGNHYLTDMFSAGHVRTPRTSIKTWYASHYPHSIDTFILRLARHVRDFLESRHPIASAWIFGSVFVPSVGDLAQQIKALGGPAMDSFSLGDIVSLALHDQDNTGLRVVSDVNEAGTQRPYRWTAVGDSHLTPSSTTMAMVTSAVRVSLSDLQYMKDLAISGGPSNNVGGTNNESTEEQFRSALNDMMQNNVFAAERYIPREDTHGENIVMNWQWGSFNSEMRAAVDRTLKTTIVENLRDHASDIDNEDARAGFLDYSNELRVWGIVEVESAIGVGAGGF